MLNVNNYGFIILRQLSRCFYRKLQFSPQLSYTSEINVQGAISWMFIRYFVTKFTYNLNKLAILETHSIKCTVTKFWVSRQHLFYAVFESTNRRFIIHSTCLLKTDKKEKKLEIRVFHHRMESTELLSKHYLKYLHVFVNNVSHSRWHTEVK